MTSRSGLFVMSQILAIRGSSQRLLRIFIQFDILKISPSIFAVIFFRLSIFQPFAQGFIHLQRADARLVAHPAIVGVKSLEIYFLAVFFHKAPFCGAISTVCVTRRRQAKVSKASSRQLCIFPARDIPKAPAIALRFSLGFPSLPSGKSSPPAS